MLPPERTTPTRAPGGTESFPARTAAAPTAPVVSTTIRARSATMRTAATISAWVTRLTPVRRSGRIGNVSAPGLVTRIPSAIVGGGGMVTRSPFWSERYVSFAVSASTPITARLGSRLLATVAQPAMSPPPPTGVTRASSEGTSWKSSSAAAPALGGGERQQLVQRAADLEGSRALEILALKRHAVAARVVERL